VDCKFRYKKLKFKLKREYKCQRGNMLNYLRNYNSKRFYKSFKKYYKTTMIIFPRMPFLTIFAKFAVTVPSINDDVHEFLTSFDNVHYHALVFNELVVDITSEEIERAIRKLNSNKARVIDNIS